jgi:hypothetical protein
MDQNEAEKQLKNAKSSNWKKFFSLFVTTVTYKNIPSGNSQVNTALKYYVQ